MEKIIFKATHKNRKVIVLEMNNNQGFELMLLEIPSSSAVYWVNWNYSKKTTSLSEATAIAKKLVKTGYKKQAA